jgi:hypothetical protein
MTPSMGVLAVGYTTPHRIHLRRVVNTRNPLIQDAEKLIRRAIYVKLNRKVLMSLRNLSLGNLYTEREGFTRRFSPLGFRAPFLGIHWPASGSVRVRHRSELCE